jgi:hypothetical protein
MGIPGDEEDSLEVAAKEDRATLGAALIMRAFRDYVQTRHGQPDPRCIAAPSAFGAYSMTPLI